MAAASAAFVSGNCILGKAQGLRAVELNLYEPEIYARLGLMLFQCRDPDNEHYLTLAREMLPTLPAFFRSEEHTSELQSLMRISYAVFCLKKKNKRTKITNNYADSTQVPQPQNDK